MLGLFSTNAVPRARLATIGLAAALIFPVRSSGQELSFLAGQASDHGLRGQTYSWIMDYRQGLTGPLEASLSGINEGHFEGHHKDGVGLDLWYVLPKFSEKVSASLGAGYEYYFDTQPAAGGDSRDVHGFAPIVAAALKWYPWEDQRFFLKLEAIHLAPTHDIHTTLFDVGVGYYCGSKKFNPRQALPSLGDSLKELQEADPLKNPDEFTAFVGPTRINTLFRTGSVAYAAEYRRRFYDVLEGSLTYLYEGRPETVRRSGLVTQAWLSSVFPWIDGVVMGVGVGPYFNIDEKHRAGTLGHALPAVAGMISPTMAIRPFPGWILRVTWDRVVTSYNRDADVWLVGIGRQTR